MRFFERVTFDGLASSILDFLLEPTILVSRDVTISTSLLGRYSGNARASVFRAFSLSDFSQHPHEFMQFFRLLLA